jgi:hypothetical protein
MNVRLLVKKKNILADLSFMEWELCPRNPRVFGLGYLLLKKAIQGKSCRGETANLN